MISYNAIKKSKEIDLLNCTKPIFSIFKIKKNAYIENLINKSF